MSSKTSNKSQCLVFRFPTRRKNSVWIFFQHETAFFAPQSILFPCLTAVCDFNLTLNVFARVCERVGVWACVWACVWASASISTCLQVSVCAVSVSCFLRLVVFCQVMRTEFCRIPIGCSHLSCCSCCCSSCLNETSYFVSSITAL